jgi:hypothetical protein
VSSYHEQQVTHHQHLECHRALIDFVSGKSFIDLVPLQDQESRAAWELVKSDRIRQLHYNDSHTGAVVELEAMSTDEARTWLEELPALTAGVLQLTRIVGLVPYTGYESLFREVQS